MSEGSNKSIEVLGNTISELEKRFDETYRSYYNALDIIDQRNNLITKLGDALWDIRNRFKDSNEKHNLGSNIDSFLVDYQVWKNNEDWIKKNK